ncbi:MAG: PorT family protein [Phycisphaerae bacterium]|nr:PorT family protein [Saprospiraceae bacterium]
MLQHEFPFDEKAWASMEALLEHEKQKPVAGPPPKPTDALPGPGRKWGLLLALIFSISLGAASLFWWGMKQKTSLSKSGPAGGNYSSVPMDSGFQSADSETKLPATSGLPSNATESANPQDLIGSSAQAGSPQSKKVTLSESGYLAHSNKQPTIPAKTPEQAGHSTGTNPIVPDQNQLDQSVAPSNSPVSTDSLNKLWLDVTNLLILAPTALVYATTDLNPDSLILPLKLQSSSIHRKERGWIFGLNANTVDNNPLRLSVLPHLGYFMNYRIRANTTLQADIILKYVTGYQLHIETTDITPGGTAHNILNTNNLLYLEVPLLVKRSFKPEQSWLLGIKPSGNVKLFSTGFASYFNGPGYRHYGSQAGVRYFDLGIVLGWEWRFRQNWALDLRYDQGLLDLTYDQFYRDNSTHLNSDLQVSLRYILDK